MKKRPVLWIVVALNLVVLVALAFVVPHLMVSPGPLAKGHEQLATDCFACHAAWRGASTPRCTECHAVADVGLKTTKGVPIPSRTVKVSFHQELIEQDCMACHSDHQGPKRTRLSRKPFAHALLKVIGAGHVLGMPCRPERHRAPRRQGRMQPVPRRQGLEARALRPQAARAGRADRCESCHSAPTDRLHRQIQGSCKSCHQTDAWKPATFDHDKYFVLDRDHQATCETCHKNNDFSRYTCYGCHEHSQAKVRAEHLEEGIRDFENCVECHRDPGVEPEKGRNREPGRREKD